MATNNGTSGSNDNNGTTTAKRGRPPVYTGSLETAIVRVIRQHGLMRGQQYLATTGVQVKPGQGRKTIKVSLPTLGKLAERHGIKLNRGRPAKDKKAKKAAA
jgi:hypothetical protein